MDYRNKIYNMDCLAGMAMLPDGCVEMRDFMRPRSNDDVWMAGIEDAGGWAWGFSL